MKSNKKIILFGAGHVGMLALSYFGTRNVYCFVDNSYGKREYNFYCGKRIISFDELQIIHTSYDVVISVHDRYNNIIKEQCRKHNIPFVCYADIVDEEIFEKRPDILQYKNIHKGDRCFIIGNGPSLRAEDLERIYKGGYISFACNFINEIFSKTHWRPDYYVTDHYTEMRDNLPFLMLGTKANFFGMDRSNLFGESSFITQDNNKAISFYRLHMSPSLPPISEDPSKYLIAHGTVMFIMLQFSIYFGFKEIVLLGFDATPAESAEADHKDKKTHFYDQSLDVKTFNSSIKRYVTTEQGAVTNEMIAASSIARAYAEDRGIRIINATRGGNLENFERVDFDSLFD